MSKLQFVISDIGYAAAVIFVSLVKITETFLHIFVSTHGFVWKYRDIIINVYAFLLLAYIIALILAGG